eukprot:m.33344 g.33344  ORF g.33344 m.33344 type:complete len:340 (-) comp15213_c0_seq1:34-1053(-)
MPCSPNKRAAILAQTLKHVHGCVCINSKPLKEALSLPRDPFLVSFKKQLIIFSKEGTPEMWTIPFASLRAAFIVHHLSAEDMKLVDSDAFCNKNKKKAGKVPSECKSMDNCLLLCTAGYKILLFFPLDPPAIAFKAMAEQSLHTKLVSWQANFEFLRLDPFGRVQRRVSERKIDVFGLASADSKTSAETNLLSIDSKSDPCLMLTVSEENESADSRDHDHSAVSATTTPPPRNTDLDLAPPVVDSKLSDSDSSAVPSPRQSSTASPRAHRRDLTQKQHEGGLPKQQSSELQASRLHPQTSPERKRPTHIRKNSLVSEGGSPSRHITPNTSPRHSTLAGE